MVSANARAQTHNSQFSVSCCLLTVRAVLYVDKGKGNAIPLQAWTGPEGSRMMRFPDFKTIDT